MNSETAYSTSADRASQAALTPTYGMHNATAPRTHRWAAEVATIAIILAVVSGALITSHNPTQAQSTALISNTGQTANSGGTTLTANAKLAQAFTLSGTANTAGYTVSSIGIAFNDQHRNRPA